MVKSKACNKFNAECNITIHNAGVQYYNTMALVMEINYVKTCDKCNKNENSFNNGILK